MFYKHLITCIFDPEKQARGLLTLDTNNMSMLFIATCIANKHSSRESVQEWKRCMNATNRKPSLIRLLVSGKEPHALSPALFLNFFGN